jgi:hypothetical protein
MKIKGVGKVLHRRPKMPHLKFYVLSLFAMKYEVQNLDITRESTSVEGTREVTVQFVTLPGEPTRIQITHGAGIMTAYSKEEAFERGLKAAHRNWPESDGWIDHSVQGNEMPRSKLLEVLDVISDDEPEQSDESEQIM